MKAEARAILRRALQGWVERSETHRQVETSEGWVSLRSIHPKRAN